MSEQDQIPELSGEQAQDFAALQAMANDAPAMPGQPEEPIQPERPPLEKEIAAALLMVSKVLGPILPTVAKIYSEETCEAVGNALAPLCNKYGWLQDGIGGKYGEEIMCLVVVGPIAYATVIAAQGDIAARSPKKQTEALAGADIENVKQPEQPAAGAKTLTVGAPIPA
jgi:hypothetical protein